jgi:hypothetical protein
VVCDKCHDFVSIFLIFQSLLNCEIVFWFCFVNFEENSYCDFSCCSWVSCFVTTFSSLVSLSSKSLKVCFSKVCFHFLYVIDLLISITLWGIEHHLRPRLWDWMENKRRRTMCIIVFRSMLEPWVNLFVLTFIKLGKNHIALTIVGIFSCEQHTTLTLNHHQHYH